MIFLIDMANSDYVMLTNVSKNAFSKNAFIIIFFIIIIY